MFPRAIWSVPVGLMPRILNARKTGTSVAGAVYVGRPSRWGNPFPVGPDRTRAEAIQQFERWLMGQPELLAAVRAELRGKDLICWCAPKRCHAEVLMREANSLFD